MRILFKYATRGRRDNFFRGLVNISSTAGMRAHRIIVSCDEDDKDMKDPEVIKMAKSYGAEVIFGPPISKVHAINRDMPVPGAFDLLINFSDDMLFLEVGWHRKMLESIKSVWGDSLDFFAHFNDGYTHDKLPTMSIMGSDYYARDGYIYHPSYGSVSCDAEAMYVAMMRGKYKYFPEIYFNHIHPANLRFYSDATYRRNDKFGDSDTKNYFERMARGFDVENPVMIPEEVLTRMQANQQ